MSSTYIWRRLVVILWQRSEAGILRARYAHGGVPWASSTATRYRQSITSCARDSTGRRCRAAQLYGDVLWRLVCFISCLCDWCTNNNHVEVPTTYRCARAPQPRGIARERWVHAKFFRITYLNLAHFLLSRYNRGLKLHNDPINLELAFNNLISEW